MFSRISVFPMVCFAVLSFAVVTRAQGSDPQMHKGTVVSASANRLVMKDTGGKEQSFTVELTTKVTVNGKPGRLEDLQETMPIQVTTDEKGKVLAVSTIDKDKCPVLVGGSTRGESLSG